MSASIVGDIEILAGRFETALREHKGTRSLCVTLEYFKEIVTPFVREIAEKSASGASATSGSVSKGRGRGVKKVAADDGEKKTPSTWNRILTSKDWGLKSRFAEDYEKIKSEKGGTSFQIISLLRTMLEGETDRTRWNEYVSWVQESLSSAPSDPPSERKAKEVKPASKVVKKSTKREESESEGEKPTKKAIGKRAAVKMESDIDDDY